MWFGFSNHHPAGLFHLLAVKSFASLILSLKSLQKMEIHYFSETEVVIFFKAEERRKLI